MEQPRTAAGRCEHPDLPPLRTATARRLDEHFPEEQFHHAFLAIEAEAAVLDVERLARALETHFGPSYFPGMTDVTIHGDSPLAIAQIIAAEYARLSEADR